MKNSQNKIAIAQTNTIIGNIEYNKNKAIENIKKAIENNMDLIVFPELYLVGNPVGNIIERYSFISNQIQEAINEIKEYSSEIEILIGYIDKNNISSIAYLKNNEINKIIKKDDFSDRKISINNTNYEILIGEELFLEKTLNSNIDAIICPSSFISRLNSEQKIHNAIISNIQKNNIDFIYVNQIGANDELVFNGFSRIYNKNSKITACAKNFEEDLLFIDFNPTNTIDFIEELTIPIQENFSLDYKNDLKRTYNSLVLSIKDYFSKNGFKRAVLGLSGGLDSTICAVLLADALGSENVLGISMPSKLTSPESKNDAKELAQNLKINFIETPIKDMQDILGEKFNKNFKEISNFWENESHQSYTQDNIQARTRATIIWGVANEYSKALPIATSDKSEAYMGYATINGDMSGGFAPILDVVKTKLFALANWMNENRPNKNAIPKSIILKRPGAELAINPETGKTLLAEEALMPYEFLDEVIWRIENFNQSIDNMMKFEFLYEKKNILDKETKKAWLEKFFRRLNTALYKWHIVPPSPIIDSKSINSIEFKQAITSNINYSK
ncbi:MAG: NAD(+) synthase [Candidatus Gastranaerophilales bacterium]|nr:NAD(+) synthase [Candidatus Gastranaerophilales bacterium]